MILSVNAACDTACSDQLVAVNLDHLMKTAVANNADLTAEVSNATVLSHIMAAGVTAGFTTASDGLKPIAADVTATHTHAGAADTASAAVKVVTDLVAAMYVDV
jgi:hypothetical protein